MSLDFKFDFPIDLFPFKIVESRILIPTEISDSLSNKSHQSFVFFDIIMKQFNFPFFPHMSGNTVSVMFFRKTIYGKSYFTQELRIPEINEKNISLIQCMVDSSIKGNLSIDNYNHIIYTIFTKVLKIYSDVFAIYGRDINGNFGYLTFQRKSKVPVFHTSN